MKKRTRLLALLLCLMMMCTVAAPALFAPQAQAASASTTQTIKLNKTKASVYNGKKLKLKISGTKKAAKWSTSNKSIAIVSQKGIVTPKKPGTVKIKAKVAGKTLACKVTVKSPLRVSPKELALNKGKAAKVKVALYLDDGDVSCKIADRSIASYRFGDWNGNKISLKIRGKKAGATTATITNTETKDKVVVKITVKDPTPTVTKKPLKVAASAVTMNRGETKTVALTAAPAANILVSVAKPSVVSCKWSGAWNGEQSAVTLTGLAKGSTTVTLTNATTKEAATLQVTVNCKHVYSDTYKVVAAPTCTVAGLEETSCIYCGERGAPRSIPATGHSFAVNFTTDKPATCKSEGVESRHCTKCDATTDMKIIPKAVHVFANEFTVDVEATCTTAGSKSRHCQNCDEKIEVTAIPATGHTFGDAFTTKEATCQTAGTETRTCSACGQKVDRTIPQKEHQYSTTFTTDTPASCTTAGSRSKHCIYCGAKTEVTVIPATGHNFGTWVESGNQMVRTCSSCGFKETKDKEPEPGETFQNPLPADNNAIIPVQSYSSVPLRQVKVKLKNVITGEAANALAESENRYNEDPGDGYNWRFFIFELTHVSSENGINDVLDASTVIWTNAFFDSSGAAVAQKDIATLSNKYKGLGVYDVKLYPGASSEVVIGLLMKDTGKDLVLRVRNLNGNTWISLNAPELSDTSSSENTGNNTGNNNGNNTGTTTPSNDVATNLTSLKNFIVKNGDTNAGGCKYVESLSKYTSSSFLVNIMYDHVEQEIRFLFQYKNTGISEMMSFYLPLTGTSKSVEVMGDFLSEVPFATLLGKSMLDISKYKKGDTLSFTWNPHHEFSLSSWEPDPDPAIAEEAATKGLTSVFSTGMSLLDKLLSDSSLHLHMSDLGFTSFSAE